MSVKKIAKTKLQEVKERIQNLPADVQAFTYVNLYHTMEELCFQKEYSLVSDLCDVLLKDGNLI